MSENESAVTIIKASAAVSKQPEGNSVKGELDPPVSFYALERAYEDSFILGGVFDKLSSAADSGWKETGNPELDAVLAGFDAKVAFENLLVYGNAFVERVRDGVGRTARLERVLTSTMRVWKLGTEDGFVQLVDGKRQFFLQEEIIHFKLGNVFSKVYGMSKFAKAVDQIVLLSQIDQYYGSLFDNGLLSPALFADKGDKNGKKLSEANSKLLSEWLKDNVSGVRNSFTAAIVPTELERLKLGEELDTTAFLQYRQDLIESIAIALNVPSDLLSSKSANRSTAETAYEMLNQIIVEPLRVYFLEELRNALRDEFGKAADEIALVPIDTKDEEVEMKTLTGYKRAGIMTANEVRARLGLPEVPEGNVLSVDAAAAQQTADQIAKEVEEIQKSVMSRYAG